MSTARTRSFGGAALVGASAKVKKHLSPSPLDEAAPTAPPAPTVAARTSLSPPPAWFVSEKSAAPPSSRGALMKRHERPPSLEGMTTVAGPAPTSLSARAGANLANLASPIAASPTLPSAKSAAMTAPSPFRGLMATSGGRAPAAAAGPSNGLIAALDLLTTRGAAPSSSEPRSNVATSPAGVHPTSPTTDPPKGPAGSSAPFSECSQRSAHATPLPTPLPLPAQEGTPARSARSASESSHAGWPVLAASRLRLPWATTATCSPVLANPPDTPTHAVKASSGPRPGGDDSGALGVGWSQTRAPSAARHIRTTLPPALPLTVTSPGAGLS
mmetsp:Transcript_19788/g.44855  ORF Transcript_19788/g.44855 Transcript_19788/m.44855 type:complete len:329 (-) Transcript_19788:371-1357(-)